MRTIGLDVGTKTIGIAVSDELGWTAQGVETIKRNLDDPEKDWEKLATLIKEYTIINVVVGLPKNMNGTIGPSGEACQQLAEEIKRRFELPVVLWDERLTTVAAEKMLIAADMSRKKRKKVIDKIAAIMILQGYLDSKS
jgi:putative Holliday junction resolvase